MGGVSFCVAEKLNSACLSWVWASFRARTRDGSFTSKSGTGLGLPLVKSLIELHGGTLELESEEGKGTLATIVFPTDRVRSGWPAA